MNYSKALNYLKTSPLFNLSLSSKELFHSNFLYWIWQISPKTFQQVMQSFGANTNQWPNNYEVRREYENFDLCVLDKGYILLVLENKVKSIPYKKQLDGYEKKVQKLYGIDGHIHELANSQLTYHKKVYIKGYSSNPETVKNKFERYDCYRKVDFILLTLPQDFPDKADITSARIWKIVDYKTYQASVLKINFTDPYNRYIVHDYSLFLDALISLYDEWHNHCYTQLFINNTSPDYVKDAKKLRIHDLYHKSKYARICTDLQTGIYNSGKVASNSYDVVENDDKTMLSHHGNCIAYGYGLTNGEPFIEVKIKPAGNNLIFAVQVQGKAYRHAVVVNHNGQGTSGIWTILGSIAQNNVVCIGNNNYPFMRYQNQQFINPPSVIDVNLIGKPQMFTATPLAPTNSPYLKFAGANSTIGMIYQYRELNNNVTTAELIQYIIKDVEAML